MRYTLTLWLCGGIAAPLLSAEQEVKPQPAEKAFQFQEGEDPVLPLKPLRPRTAAEQARVNALAWYAAGQMLQTRNDPGGALKAYKKAVEVDPTAVVVYRAAIPLAVSLNQIDDAVRWAQKAVELNPDDHQLLMQAGALLINRGDLSGAIELLEKAAKSPGIETESPLFVNLMRDLAILYSAAERKEDAAVAFEVVFNALQNPDKFKLDFRTRGQLLNNPATNYERMGQVFLDAKKTELALQAFQKAAESKKGPAAGNLSFNLAQVYLQADQGEKALEEIQKYIDQQRQSKGRVAYELLADILKKLDRSKDLLPRLEAAAEKDSRNSTLQFFLADQYVAADRLEEAEKLYKKTLESASELPGYIGLASVYRRQNKPAELLETLGKGYAEAGDLKGFTAEFKAIVADEKLLGAILENGDKLLAEDPPKIDFAAGYALANLAADGKKTEAAEKYYRFILSLRKERAGLVLEELGSHYAEVKKYAEAAKVYQEAVDDPALAENRPSFLYQLSRVLELGGNTEAALKAITSAQQVIPNDPLLRFQEGWVYYHSHRFDEAIERMEKLIADFPQPQARDIVRQAKFSLSNIHVLKGDLKKGEEILEEYFKNNPNDTSVNNDLGYLYADQGKNLDQAEKMIRKALDAEPENGAYLDSMGWVLFKRGKVEEALPFLEKAVKNSNVGGDETLWDHLGDVYDRLKNREKALQAWKKSLETATDAFYPDKKLLERVKEKIDNYEKKPDKPKP